MEERNKVMTLKEKEALEKKGYDSLDACLYLTQEVLVKMIRTGSKPEVLREYLEQRVKGIILEIELEEYEKAVQEEQK